MRFTAAVGGVLSALAVEVDIQAPKNRLADYLIGLSQLAVEGAEESPVLRGDTRVAERSRTRDLCIVPVVDPSDGQRSVIEAVVFGSGRPVLTFRPGVADLPTGGLGTIVLAWDGARTAARAMADALPVMQTAREVRVLTVTNEKPSAHAGLGKDVVRHLAAHGVNAVVEEVDAGGRRIGMVLEEYLSMHRPDLFVMGAYGRSRAREFILGGATEHMLLDPKAPLLLSH